MWNDFNALARADCSQAVTSRREFMLRSGGGFGALAMAAMLHDEAVARLAVTGQAGGAKPVRPLTAHSTHFRARARQIIYLFMHGGPSHVDLFDPKPALDDFAGQPLPESFGKVMTRRDVARNGLLPAVRKFRPRGQSGVEISDFLPHLSTCADELAVIRSCHGNSVNHPQSVYQMNTGSVLMGRPSTGSWVAYGLGTENQNMPAFVVLPDPSGLPKGGAPAWGSGFLPASYQGTLMRAGREPVLNLRPSPWISSRQQRGMLDLVGRLNQRHLREREFDDELLARLESYELAFRMQAAVPEIVDLKGESAETKAHYGIGEKETNEFGTRCLLARRMI